MNSSYLPQTAGHTEVVSQGIQQYLCCLCMITQINGVGFFIGRNGITIPHLTFPGFSLLTKQCMEGLLRLYFNIYWGIIKPRSNRLGISHMETNFPTTQKQSIQSTVQMENQAYSKRIDVELRRVICERQSYQQGSLAKRSSNKLSKWYYGPFSHWKEN